MRGSLTAMLTTLRRLAAPLAGAVLLAACFGGGAQAPRPVVDPETRFGQAMHEFRTGNFGRSLTMFQAIQFELSNRDTLLPKTRFYMAESHAGAGDFIAAAREFRRVADDFPSDALAPLALLRAGDQFGRMWRRPELDASNGETALATYQELIGRFPESSAARIAQARVRQLEDMYARKDYENGLFYFKRGGWDSAILYFRSLIAHYPGASVVPDAYVKLVQAYDAIGYVEERRETCDHLREHYGSRADVRRVCGDRGPGR